MHAMMPRRPASDSAAGRNYAAELVRTHQAWKGNNKFLFQGRVILGPDWRSIPLTIFLVVAPVVVFCVFVARKLMDDFPHHLGILVMVCPVVFTLYDLVLLLLTSGRDPGIVPRSTHPPETEIYDDAEAGNRRAARFPRFKEVVVNGTVVRTKYCETCQHYRPPRCSHCSICDNCVERFDHHCPWVGQCIGKRNYRFFFMFVSSLTLLCIYIFSFCWVYIIRIMHSERTSVWKAMVRTPASMALIIYAFLAVWFVGGLTVFHLYLICTNQTTYENYRNRCGRGNEHRPHPYNRGIINNLKEVFCSRIPPSKNKFRAKVAKETEMPPRMVGGRFSDPDVEKNTVGHENGRKLLLEELAIVNGDKLEKQLGSDDSLDRYLRSAAVSPAPVLNTDLPTEDDVADNLHPRQSSWRRSGNQDRPSDASLTPPDLSGDLPTEEGAELVRDSPHRRQSSWRRRSGNQDIPSDASLAPDDLPTEVSAEVVEDSSDPRQSSWRRVSGNEEDTSLEAVATVSQFRNSKRFGESDLKE